jgi:hypothetical protein
MTTNVQVAIDCADPAKLAEFWAALLGYEVQGPPPGFASWEAWLEHHNVPREDWNKASAVVDPKGEGPRVFFQQVPEAKTVKNRVHLDVKLEGGQAVPVEQRRGPLAAQVERLTALGAAKVAEMNELGQYWIVLRDPEGNEFCIS